MPIYAAPPVLPALDAVLADPHASVKDDASLCVCLTCRQSAAATASSCLAADDSVAIVAHDSDAVYEPLIESPPVPLQFKLTFQSRRPIAISPPALPSPPSFASSSKLRSFSDVSDASSRLSIMPSSPTDSSFSSPPSSPFLDDHHRGRRSPSFSSSTSSSPSSSFSSSVSSPSSGPYSPSYTSFPPPDPYRDITRLRNTSRGNHVLHPGASFSGTQKSGRNNYEVEVTVVDVDFNTSFLCGYLRIKGLTDDWPDLTTYFNAEIIGERFGFLTSQQDHGATETEDMTHWGRFPAFRTLKSEMRRPGLTISDRHREKRGVVFMRWKERFLVPDWKVKDINGASFAGFYYICVEFNPSRASTYPNTALDDPNDFPSLSSPTSSRANTGGPATMTGFYYHAESEPYQQLSLTHVPEKATPTFEFR